MTARSRLLLTVLLTAVTAGIPAPLGALQSKEQPADRPLLSEEIRTAH